MKKIFLCISIIFLSVFLSEKVQADVIDSYTTIEGVVTWSNENSPYIIRDTIYVPEGSTLIINQGVQIHIEQGGFYAEGEIKVGEHNQKPVVIINNSEYTTFDISGGDAYINNIDIRGNNKFSRVRNSGYMSLQHVNASSSYGGGGYISVFGNSKIDIKDSTFVSIDHRYVVEVFNGSQMYVSDSVFSSSSQSSLVQIFDSTITKSQATVTKSVINYLPHNGIEVFNGARVHVEHTIMENIQNSALLIHAQGIASVSSSTINTVRNVSEVYNAKLMIQNSNLEGYSNMAIESYGATTEAQHNWWGRESGPGIDQDVTAEVVFYPWATSRIEWNDGLSSCCSNILFIPGIQASRLYKKDRFFENQLWEPNRNDDVKKLYLNVQGESRDPSIYTKDIIKTSNIFGPIAGVSLYKDFTTNLDKLVASGTISEWKSVPYDWRLSYNSLITNGILGVNNKRTYPVSIIEQLASTSRTKKVTIVAHSNGGLLTKALVRELKNQHKDTLIDKIIFVSVPEYGTPEAMVGLLHGDKQNIMGGLILNKITAKDLAHNMPSAYTLLPSEKYFEKSIDPQVIKFTSASSTLVYPYGPSIQKTQDLYDFLLATKKERSVSPYNLSQSTWPSILNSALLTQAKNFHLTYDAWLPPQHIKVVTISGMGKDTLSGVEYFIYDCKKGPFLIQLISARRCGFNYPARLPMTSSNGDGVVMGGSIQVRPKDFFFVNLFGINEEVSKNFGHSTMLNIPEVYRIIESYVLNAFVPQQRHVYLIGPSTLEERNPYNYRATSEAWLSATDESGNVTGAVESTDVELPVQIKEAIPNSAYFSVGEGQSIVTAKKPKQITIKGNEVGMLSIYMNQPGKDSVETFSFSEIPVTPLTTGLINVSTTTPIITLDDNADGKVDRTILPEQVPEEPVDQLAFLAHIRRRIASSSEDQHSLITKRYLDRFDAIERALRNKNMKEAKRLTGLSDSRVILSTEDLRRHFRVHKSKKSSVLLQYSILYTAFADLYKYVSKLN